MGKLIELLHKIFSWENLTLRNYTAFIFVLMLIQYIPIESRFGVSWVKVLTMAITPIVLLRHFKVTKAFVCVLIYFTYLMVTSYLLHGEYFRASTIIYALMFLMLYVSFYNFVWVQRVFTLESFINLVGKFLLVLTGFLIAQQICILIGLKYFPPVNLCQVLNRGIGANSLSFEPSSLARTMAVLYYAYLKCNEYRTGHRIGLSEIFSQEYRKVTIAFLWSMLTMGSGTAFICLGVLSLYFMRGMQLLITLPVFLGIYAMLSFCEVEQFKRIQGVVSATSSGDAQEVKETDNSAAYRIKPWLNTINLDFSDPDNWVGKGCDAALRGGMYSDTRYIGQITDYGIISYILSLVIVFTCAIDFFSIPCLMFFIGIGGGTDNISYGWGLLLVFTCVKYFHYNAKYGEYFSNDRKFSSRKKETEAAGA